MRRPPPARAPLRGVWALLAGMTLVAVVVVVGLVVVGDSGLDGATAPQLTTPSPPNQVIASAPGPAPRRPQARRAARATAPVRASAPVSRAERPAPRRVLRERAPHHRRPAPAHRAPRPVIKPPPAAAPAPAPPVVAAPPAAAPAPAAPPVIGAPSPAPASPALTLTLRSADVPGVSQGKPGSRRVVLHLVLSGPALPQPAEMTLRVQVAGLPPGLGTLTSSVDVVGSPDAPDALQLRLRTQVGAPGDAAAVDGASNVVQVSAPLAAADDDETPAPPPPPSPGAAQVLLPLAGSDGVPPAALPVPGPAADQTPTVAARLDTGDGGTET